MAAGGSSGGGGGSSKASAGALEAALDRKMQAVTNTMESIQNLSGWCIENKKHHATIVHYWIKWFRRSGFSHRLNLFYLANDIIQNCKRKNAIIYRDTFADVLPEAASLVRDPSVSKSVERVFKIWEDRNVYHEETIASFKSALGGGWNKRERSERSKSSRAKPVEKPPETAPVNPKAVLKSKIVAEFRPQSLIDDLLSYKRSLDNVELKEKQLSNMRVDVCSTETLKRLKDKAGGKKFSKDFEEASAKLEEFVGLLDKQVKNGPSLPESLENAGIFYEAQYREVKVVVNAYKTFANRVNNLKKKLDQLKATLPDPEESPVQSPTLDAPSPTGSESPFQGMGDMSPLSPETEPVPSDSPEPPKDNRIVEDMELSDVDADEEMPQIIVEERKESSESVASTLKDTVGSPATTQQSDDTATTPVVTSSPSPSPITSSAPAQALTPTVTAATSAPVTPSLAKTVTPPLIPPSIPLALPNLANVDLGKISSILSSLTSVMKTGVSPAAKPSPGTPTTPTSNLGAAVKPPVQSAPNPLANILSKVEITPESILSALSKTQVPSAPSLQGLSSLIQSVALHSGSSTISTSTAPLNTAVQTVKARNTPSVTPLFLPKTFGYSPTNSDVSSTSTCKPLVPPSSDAKQPQSIGFPSQPNVTDEKMISQPPEMHKPPEEVESSSLELKIHNFLKGNPGFSGLDLNIPILSGLGSTAVSEAPSEFNSTTLDNVDGTPVRDERSGTPTQDEIMDKPTSSNVESVSLLSKIISPGSSTPSSTRSPLLTKDTEFQKLQSLPPYRSYGIGENSPSAYIQASEVMEKPSVDSTLEKFFPDTSFHEDEDYRDFEFAGPTSSSVGNLDKRPSKSILKSNMHLDSMEYPPNQGFGQTQDFRQSFTHSVQPPFNTGEKGGSLSPSSDMYGGYNLRGSNIDASASPTLPKDDPFYPSDTNHNIQTRHSVMAKSQYSESSHASQNRHSNFHAQNNPPPTRTIGSEQSGSSISASTTIEFKNMLKNASRRPSEEKFGQTSLNEDIHISSHSHTGVTSEDCSEEQYRIETRVSSSSTDLPDSTEEKGAPIETLGYHNMGNMRYSGEPIKTVESMRVGMKTGRPHGIDGSRSGWFEMGSTGSSFDEGPSSADEQPSVGGNTGGVGYKTQYDEHLTRFQDSVNDFRAKNIPPFEHLLPPPPPPSMVSPLDRGGPFQMEQAMPPSGPPPGLPPDHGSIFPRDISVSSHIQSVEPPKSLPHVAHPPNSEHGRNPFPIHHSTKHGGIPFSPPPRMDMRHPFSQDHSAAHQGTMEPFPMHPMSARDHEHLSRENSQHNQPLGRVNEPMGPISRDLHGGFSGPSHHVGSHHMNTGGMRAQRPQFRPREPYHNLKRPRPPFGRGSRFFSPKRPYYQPRY
ncbi:regulation of nuclear pre-mRNA domain-containing protein 2 [Hyla sarda]|uniref:regulation of nuclear pre-mRNA domain-containing protein 2 n=1 Tax=Hyla sarda TaxID=327740 RepID=UPI0024C4075E|nr:regulation of nuclear pre-mRNA domain-containing protein 2 [Hyla sarda]